MNKISIMKRLDAIEKQRKALKETQEYINSIDICEHIAPVYMPLHDDVINNRYQNINLPGGRGSCKSSFVSLEIVDGIMKNTSGSSNAIVFRRYANTMRDSVYSQISWAIEQLGVSQYWRGSVSPMQFTYLPTGAQILFRGLDDTSKLKSVKPRKGIFRYVWFEEFSELPGANFTRNVMQSVIRGEGNFTVFRSFNPPQSKSNWANTYISIPDERSITLHTSYLDVPAEWLGNSFIYDAEKLKTINETAYRHEYLGEATGTGGAVFPNITIREITDKEIIQMQYIYNGIDFGFSVDPASFIRLSYDNKKDTIYLIDEIYKRNLSNKQLADEIKEKGYDVKIVPFNSYPYYGDIEEKERIIADCAEPKSIADLKAEGLKVLPCTKFPGCVNYRIKWLQHRNIVIDPKRTPHAYKEFVEYEYLRDKDGEFISDVPDKNNHAIDAVAYSLDRIINSRRNPA